MGYEKAERPTLGPRDAWIDQALVMPTLPRRRPGAHKWGVGGLVIVAGAPGYAGAAVLTSMAAGRAGAGIVLVACPRSVAASVVQHVPEAVIVPLSESESTTSGRRLAEQLTAPIEKAAALVIGPGLGDDDAAAGVMRVLLGGGAATRQSIGFGGAASEQEPTSGGIFGASEKPAVIDADGLNWLAQHEAWWNLLPAGRVVLTPHLGEFARLRGVETDAVLADPLGAARAAAQDWGQVVVLKSGYAIVTDGDRAHVASEAAPALASAGTGDVLAGTIGAFLAQGLAPFAAATLAIYAGEQAAATIAAEVGTLGLIASDLPRAIAITLAKLERAEESTRG